MYSVLLYDFNQTGMNLRTLHGHIHAPVSILNLVSILSKFNTPDTINNPSNTTIVYACAASSPPNLLQRATSTLPLMSTNDTTF
jgi:hypothetical protein